MSDKLNDTPEEPTDEFTNMVNILSADIHAIEHQLNVEDLQVWRRSLYRAMFALIEGVNHCFKKDVLQTWCGIIGENTELQLQDIKATTDNAGNHGFIRSFQPFSQNLDFAFDTYAWTAGSSFVIDKNSKDWKSLLAANEVRNRIVHPKSPFDLIVSDEEMDLLRATKQWYHQQVLDLLHSTFEATLDELHAFEKAAELHGIADVDTHLFSDEDEA